MVDLPQDLVAFLKDNKQLNFDSNRSETGQIKLVSVDHLKLIHASCEAPIDVMDYDEYQDMNGYYLVPAFDLVEWSENYDPEGLLAYFPITQSYGSYDPEHNVIKLFKNTQWEDIVNDPIRYLEEQWNSTRLSYELVPWPGYDFNLELEDEDFILKGYPDHCPIHDKKIKKRKQKSVLSDHYDLNIDLIELLKLSQKDFPFSGQQVDARNEISCKVCKKIETKIIKKHLVRKRKIEMTTNDIGFLKCPKCENVFRYNDENAFKKGMHECGQKINIQVHPDYKGQMVTSVDQRELDQQELTKPPICPRCNNECASPRAIMCSTCGYNWERCKACGKDWVRGTLKCACGYDPFDLPADEQFKELITVDSYEDMKKISEELKKLQIEFYLKNKLSEFFFEWDEGKSATILVAGKNIQDAKNLLT